MFRWMIRKKITTGMEVIFFLIIQRNIATGLTAGAVKG